MVLRQAGANTAGLARATAAPLVQNSACAPHASSAPSRPGPRQGSPALGIIVGLLLSAILWAALIALFLRVM